MPIEVRTKYVCDLCKREEEQKDDLLSTSGRWDLRTVALYQGITIDASYKLKTKQFLTCLECTPKVWRYD